MTAYSVTGWESLSLGQLAQIERGKFSARPRNDPKFYGGRIPFIQTGDIRNSRGRVNSFTQTLNERGLSVSRLFPRGTLFMTIAANVGYLGVVDFACACPDSLVAIKPRPGVNKRWLFYALSAKKAEFEAIATSNAQANLNLEKLNPFVLQVPPESEQAAIAEVLDDATREERDLERKIAKSSAIKLSLMQELLSGRTRLPGWSAAWPTVTLGESGFISGGGVDKLSRARETPVLLLNYMDVYRAEFVDAHTATQAVTTSQSKIVKCSVRAGDVFFTPTSETPDDIARSAIAEVDLPGVVYSYHLVRWRPSGEWDLSYLGYAFSTPEFRSQVSTLAAGSGTRYVVSMPSFRRVSVPQPPLEEQREIGKVLRDASAEVEALVERLIKTRNIKAALLQQLLTGRTRVSGRVLS